MFSAVGFYDLNDFIADVFMSLVVAATNCMFLLLLSLNFGTLSEVL